VGSESPSINLIGNGTKLVGDVRSNGDFRIDGHLKGTISVKGKLVVAEGNGPNLNADGKNIMKNADPGTRVLIDARVKGPDGRVNSASCGIKVNK